METPNAAVMYHKFMATCKPCICISTTKLDAMSDIMPVLPERYPMPIPGGHSFAKAKCTDCKFQISITSSLNPQFMCLQVIPLVNTRGLAISENALRVLKNLKKFTKITDTEIYLSPKRFFDILHSF